MHPHPVRCALQGQWRPRAGRQQRAGRQRLCGSVLEDKEFYHTHGRILWFRGTAGPYCRDTGAGHDLFQMKCVSVESAFMNAGPGTVTVSHLSGEKGAYKSWQPCAPSAVSPGLYGPRCACARVYVLCSIRRKCCCKDELRDQELSPNHHEPYLPQSRPSQAGQGLKCHPVRDTAARRAVQLCVLVGLRLWFDSVSSHRGVI